MRPRKRSWVPPCLRAARCRTGWRAGGSAVATFCCDMEPLSVQLKAQLPRLIVIYNDLGNVRKPPYSFRGLRGTQTKQCREAGRCELVQTLRPSCDSDCSKTRAETHLQRLHDYMRHPKAILPLLMHRHIMLHKFLQASSHAYSTSQIPDFRHSTHSRLNVLGVLHAI